MDLGKFFTPRYLFDTTLAPWQGFGEEVLYFCLGLIVAGIILKALVAYGKIEAVQTRLFGKLGTMGMTMGFLGLFFWVCRQQYIPVFNMRFWWIVWLLGVVVWVVFIVKNVKKLARNKEAAAKKQEVFDKYLPGMKS